MFQFRKAEIDLTPRDLDDLPFQLLHCVLRCHPGPARATPAGRAGDGHLHPQRIRQAHGIAERFLPAVAQVGALEGRRLGHVDAAGVELVEAGDAGGIHPFQVLPDAVKGDLAVHPVPPDVGPGRFGRVLEVFDQFRCAVGRRCREGGKQENEDCWIHNSNVNIFSIFAS